MGTLSAQNSILFARLLISGATLYFLVKYVRATQGIEIEALEQTEGLSKPVIAVCLQSATTDMAIIEGLSCEIAGDQIELKNIGTGPALKLRWCVNEKRQNEPALKRGTGGFVPYLEPGKTVNTNILRAYITAMEEFRLECSYTSVSDAKYISSTEFHGTLAADYSVQRG